MLWVIDSSGVKGWRYYWDFKLHRVQFVSGRGFSVAIKGTAINLSYRVTIYYAKRDRSTVGKSAPFHVRLTSLLVVSRWFCFTETLAGILRRFQVKRECLNSH